MALILILTAVLVGASVPALAHPVPFSYVDVRIDGRTVNVSVVVHAYDLANDLGLDVAAPERLLDPAILQGRAAAIATLLDARLRISADGRPLTHAGWSSPEPLIDRTSVRTRARFESPSPPGSIAIDMHLFPYDPAHRTFVNVYEGDDLQSQTILDSARPRFEHYAGTHHGTVAVIRRFIPSGVHHILIGPDHLLFLIGLLLLGGTVRQLVLVVTGFTVAHSVTLSLAALGLLIPPANLIEPAIALSIVYVGIDNLMVREGRDMRAWIALVFGLIHGFGFANVLREMSLPAKALGWSLFSFNLGVEIGQLMVVVLVASVLSAVRSRSEVAGRRVAVAGSVIVIAAGAFWFVERVFFPGNRL